jgi:hypothetical protein
LPGKSLSDRRWVDRSMPVNRAYDGANAGRSNKNCTTRTSSGNIAISILRRSVRARVVSNCGSLISRANASIRIWRKPLLARADDVIE